MNEPILEMRNIYKRFPGTQALSGVNFKLQSSEVHALIGANGAGKSTLMKILMGIYKMDEGEIRLNGQKVEINYPYEALLNGISMVPQELNLVPDLSVAENIFLGNENNFIKKGGLLDWESIKKEAIKVLNQVGVEVDPKQKVRNLSAAYQQLVSIARSLAAGSKILIMDEPTASLTIEETETLFKIIKKLQNEGRSIIYITHHLEEVEEICNSLTIMRDGKVVFDDTKIIPVDDMIFYMSNKKAEEAIKEFREVTTETFFEVKNLNRRNEFENISFKVKKGEIFGIAGLIGAGRTELLNAIFGVTKKHSGEIIIDKKAVQIKCASDAVNFGMGYVPEERRKMGIFALLSVTENIMLPSYKMITRRGLINFKKAREETCKLIKDLSIKTPSTETQLKNLSGGNQQKVILARWMTRGVKLLILDEPTRGIDVNAKVEIHKLIKQLAHEGITIIVVSSEIDEVISLADRIMVIHEGKIKGFINNPHECDQEDILRLALK